MDEEIKGHMLLKDASFDQTPSSLYKMILSFGKTSLESAVFDPSKEKFVAFLQYNIQNTSGKQAYFDQLNQILTGEELLKLPYKSISIIWQSQCVTMVPMPLYDEKEQKTYLKFNQNLNVDDVILSDKLQSAGSFNIFAISPDLVSRVSFMNPRIHHHSSVFVESLLLLNRHNINPLQVYLHVHTGFFDLVVLNDRKLRFCNSFSYASAEDFIYFVLFTFEQLKLMPEQVMVTLSGEIVKNSAIFEIMYKYIRNISFAEPISQVTNSYILQDIEAYRYQNLFNAMLCEL